LSPDDNTMNGYPASVRVVRGEPAEALQAVVDRATTEAFEAGYQTGREEAAAGAHTALAAAIAAAAEDAVADVESQREACARTAGQLAVEIARVLLRREIKAGNYDLSKIVRESLVASEAGRGICRIHLNPADAESLSGEAYRAGTEIVPDPAVRAGDARIETARGTIVRSMDAALAAIAERIEEAA